MALGRAVVQQIDQALIAELRPKVFAARVGAQLDRMREQLLQDAPRRGEARADRQAPEGGYQPRAIGCPLTREEYIQIIMCHDKLIEAVRGDFTASLSAAVYKKVRDAGQPSKM